MEGLIAFCNTLTSALTQKSASAIWAGWNLQLYAVLWLQKKGVQVQMEGWALPELLKSQNDWVVNLFFWGCHARGLCPRPYLDTYHKNLH